jgi:hypothetical protein
MITSRSCPECGSEIIFQYLSPKRTYRIEGGKFVRDDAWAGPLHDNPYLDFFCSNDKAHEIEKDSIIYEKDFFHWAEEIEDEFYTERRIDL